MRIIGVPIVAALLFASCNKTVECTTTGARVNFVGLDTAGIKTIGLAQ